MRISIFSVLFFAALFPLRAQDLAVAVGEKGVEITGAGDNLFTIGAPILDLDGKKWEDGTFEAISGTEGVARYPSGNTIHFRIEGGKIDCQFEGTTQPKTSTFQIIIPESFGGLGKFSINAGEVHDLPMDPEKPIIAKASDGRSFTLYNEFGDGLKISFPPSNYAVADNRATDWKVFVFRFAYSLAGGGEKNHFTIAVEPAKVK